jgi:hypothetical protein
MRETTPSFQMTVRSTPFSRFASYIKKTAGVISRILLKKI